MDLLTRADELRRNRKGSEQGPQPPNRERGALSRESEEAASGPKAEHDTSGKGPDVMRLGLIGVAAAHERHGKVPGPFADQANDRQGSAPQPRDAQRSNYPSTGEIRSVLNLNLDRLVIGRDPDCDICLDDASVGQHHALLTRKGTEFWLQDLDSSAGTRVNDEPVTKRLLEDDDEISIGDYGFRFLDRERPDGSGWQRALIAAYGDTGGEEVLLRNLLGAAHTASRQEPPDGGHADASVTDLSGDVRPSVTARTRPLPKNGEPAALAHGRESRGTDEAQGPTSAAAESSVEAQNRAPAQSGRGRFWLSALAAGAAVTAIAVGILWLQDRTTHTGKQPDVAHAHPDSEMGRTPPDKPLTATENAVPAAPEKSPSSATVVAVPKLPIQQQTGQIAAPGAKRADSGGGKIAPRVTSQERMGAKRLAVAEPSEALRLSAPKTEERAQPPAPSQETETDDPGKAVPSKNASQRPGSLMETRAESDTAKSTALGTQASANPASKAQQRLHRSSPGGAPPKTQRVAARSLVTALLDLQEGDPAASLAIAEEGLAVAPQDPGLLAVREEAKRRLAEQARRKAQIAELTSKLLAQADEQRAKHRLTLPPGDNAYETYRRILSIDPTNARARAGLADLAGDYLELAKRTADARNWTETLEYTGRGLAFAPTHPELLALRSEAQHKLSAGRSAPKPKQKPENSSQSTARGSGKPANPKPEDPLSQRAARDVGRFIAGLHAKARQLQKQGRIEESNRLLQTGLRIVPGHPALLQLQKELRQ